jgi:serine/threonine-protein kinase
MGRTVDERSQVYVIGVLAYELSVGRLPFHRARGPAGMITAQLTQRPDSPSMLRPEISRQFDTFVLGLLQKDPALRPDIPAVLESLDGMGMLDTIDQRS